MSYESDDGLTVSRLQAHWQWLLLILRWIARLAGTAMALLIVTIAIGEGGPPNPWSQPWKVNLELHLMLAIWAGLLLGWKWEGLGGAMVVGGLLAFAGLEGRMPHAVFGTMLVPGLMYLCCWCSERRAMRPEGDTKSRPY